MLKRGRGRPPYETLFTPSEMRVLELLRQDMSNGEIAQQLGISVQGVKFHVSNMLGKLGVDTRHDLARWTEPAPSESAKSPYIPRNIPRIFRAAAAILAVGAIGAAALVVVALRPQGEPEEPPASEAPIVPSATHEGISIAVRQVIADANGTRVVLDVAGRPELGAGVLPLRPATLHTATGGSWQEVGGAPLDSNNPRQVFRDFPALPEGTQQFTVKIDGIVLVSVAGGPAPTTQSVDATWELRVTLAQAVTNGELLSVTTVAEGTAPQVLVDSAVRTRDSVLIQGHLEGVASEDVPNLLLTVSADASGRALSPRQLRWGFGENRSQFTIVLPGFSGDAELECVIALTGGTADPSVAAPDEGEPPAPWEFLLSRAP